MPKGKEYEQPVEILESDKIARISAMFKRSGRWGSEGFIGVTEDGKPTIVYGRESLTQEALESLKLSLVADQDIKTLSDEFKPVKFKTHEIPVDQKDSRYEKTDDLLRFLVEDSQGNISTILVKERAILDAICEPLKWLQIVNPGLGETSEVATTQTSYTIVVEGTVSGDQQTYAIMLDPKMNSASNEENFKKFAFRVISSFLNIDLGQPPRSKKGYERIMLKIDPTYGLEGGLAYQFAQGLAELDLFKLNKDEMDELAKRSSTTGIVGQLSLMGEMVGLMEKDNSAYQKGKNPFESMKIEDVFSLLILTRDLVNQAFR